MSTPTRTSDVDVADLAAQGYDQELRRTLGGFSTFAASFSSLSILTSLLLFNVGFGNAGPAWIWAWVAVFVGQFFVGINFSELAAHYPLAGAVYNWSKRIAPRWISWMGAYFWVWTLVMSYTSVALLLQTTLPQIWSGFQVVGNGTGVSFAQNAVLLGGIWVIVTTIINSVGIRVIRTVNNAGVIAELVGVAALIIALAVNSKRGPQVIFHSQGTAAGHALGYVGALLLALVVAAYASFGFDAAASLAEEAHEPRRKGPRAMLMALGITGIFGGLVIVFAEMAVGNIHSAQLSSVGLPYVIKDVLGNTAGKIFLVDVTIAVMVCAVVIQSAAVRMIFAMARDGRIPMSKQLAEVDVKTRLPVIPAITVGIVAILLMLANINQPQLITALISISIVLACLSYLAVIGPLLARRLAGWPPRSSHTTGLFSLGRFGVPSNIVAFVFLAVIAVYLALPQRAVYNPVPPFHWYLQWSPILYVAVIAGIGAWYYLAIQRRREAAVGEYGAEAPGMVTETPGLVVGAPGAVTEAPASVKLDSAT